MTGMQPSRTILLFGPGTAILPSQPITAPASARSEGQGRRSRRALARFTLNRSEHAGSAFPYRVIKHCHHQEMQTMGLVTLAMTCGLAVKAALFVPLHGSPRCHNLAKTVYDHRSSLVAVWQHDIAAASRRFGMPERWIKAVMRVESDGHLTLNGQLIRSPAGAMGLMQVMPRTYAELRARYDLGANPYAPRNNIMAGTAYLREMFDRFGAPWFLAAYNAGPARLEQTLLAGRALPMQTQRYLEAIAPRINASKETSKITKISEESEQESIFADQTATGLRTIRDPSPSADSSLFVARVEPIGRQGWADPTP